MQSLFNVTSIKGDYSNKKIVIQTTFTVDPTSVNKKSVKIVEASSGTTVIYKLSVDKDKIIIILKEWPNLDTFYQINVTDIKDKLGRELVHPITKNIEFKADTKLKAEIVFPRNNEAVIRQHNLVYFAIKQINSDNTSTVNPNPDYEQIVELPNDFELTDVLLQNSSIEAMLGVQSDIKYHFEFSSDVAFFDVVKDYTTAYTDGLIELDNGQYYMRVRIIENDMTGDWSEVITFSIVPKLCTEADALLTESQKNYLEEVLAPVDFFLDEEEEIKIISKSSNGETYPEFYIEFNIDIDSSSLPEQLIAYRREL